MMRIITHPSYPKSERTGAHLVEPPMTIRWTDEQIEKLKVVYFDHTATELSAIFNKTRFGVYMKAKKLGLVKAQNISAGIRRKLAGVP